MPAAQEAEHRFAMGELPDEVMEIRQRLAKLTETLRAGGALSQRSQRKKPGRTILCVCIG